jgi:autotransporter-associated beta strand protein
MHDTYAGCHSSKIFKVNLCCAALLFTCAAFFAVPDLFADTLIWSGGGATANWSDSGNWFGVVPNNGDILVFQGGQPKPTNTNNIAGLTLNQIRFIGASGGYNIFGNSFTLSNLVSSIEATNTAGINQINNDISIPAGNLVVNVAPSAKLILFGVLSGPGGIIKNGGGTNQIAGPNSNTYGGTTTVNAGLMELNKLGFPLAATAISGNAVVVGNGTNSATLRNLAQLEIVDSATMTINDSSTWDLGTWSETIGNSLTLSGATVMGSGTMGLSPNNTVTFTGNDSTISANFDVGSGTCTMQVNSYLNIISGVISGTANITKNGDGNIQLANQNTFTGSFTANNSGYVWIFHPLSLGTSAGGATFNDTSSLAIDGNITVTNALFLNSHSIYAIQNFNADTNTWTGPVTFGTTNSTIWVVTNGSFVVNGTPSGPGGFIKTGAGLLTLGGSGSSYAGDTTVNEGILLLNAANVIRYGTLTIGDGISYNTTSNPQPSDIVRYLTASCIFGGAGGSRVVIKSSGWLDLNGFFDDVGPIAMDGGQITTGASGTLRLFPPFNTYKTDPTNGTSFFTGNLDLRENSNLGMSNSSVLDIVGPVTSATGPVGAYSLIKNGPGTLYLTSSNSYTGPTIIQEGILYAQNASALGTTDSGTVVSNNATLALLGPNMMGITNEALSLNGLGTSFVWGNLDVETSGTNFWVGPITLNADSMVTAYWNNVPPSVLRIISSINGPGGFTTLPAGSGIIYMDGATSNSYAGLTRVLGGTLLLNKSFSDGAIPGNAVVASTLRLLATAQINNTADVLVQASGLFDFGPYTDGIDTLHGNGSITFGTSGWLDIGMNNGTSSFDGLMSGIGYVGGYTVGKWGTGTFTMNGNNTYQNRSDVYGGTLVINGFQPQSPAFVSTAFSTASSLAGSGTVGDILCEGHLFPSGIFTCSNLAFTASGSFHETINGRFPGTTYDQMNVRGTNNLANAVLALGVPLANGVSVGDQIVMINNDGVDPITGIFAGYPQGSSYNANGFTFVIAYNGGTGNDVVFNVTSVPGDAVSSSVTAGNGDHIIGPNECNNLNIVITNKTAIPMTGITASLSTTTIGVEVTQPYSSYADVPGNGKGTNIAPFQISTLPSFPCGQDINLQLTVHPASGAFTVPLVVHSGTPGNVPVRVDNGIVTGIPDIGFVESTNIVSGFVGQVAKVTVELYLTHTFDSDLTNISLIAPDGTTVLLSSANGGAGQNYGSSCSPDASRTTFDDAALTPIASGVAPFMGTFRPQSPLSAFINDPIPNGNWRLHIADGFGGSLGTLRCWSLLLFPTTCAPGSGICGFCTPPISGSITTNDLVEPTRVSRNGFVSSCGAFKAFPGTLDSNLHYKAHTFTNTSGADACVTIELAASCDVQAVAYLGAFDTNNLASNYLGDSGASTSGGGTNSFSCDIAAGARFVVVVNEVASGAGCNNYTLSLSGLPCPPPALSVEDVPTANAHLYWPNSAGGYLLESSPLVQPTTWTAVTNEPIILNGNYNVTNGASAPSRFYRLHKP